MNELDHQLETIHLYGMDLSTHGGAHNALNTYDTIHFHIAGQDSCYEMKMNDSKHDKRYIMEAVQGLNNCFCAVLTQNAPKKHKCLVATV